MCLVFRAKLQHPSLRNELSPFLLASSKTVFGFFLCHDWWKNIYIYRTFLVTLALRHLTKLNHGRRKFAAHFRIFKFHVQVMPGLCIRFSYSVFWNRKAVIRLVIFSFNLPWIDMVKKRKVICMLNYLTKCWTPFLGQRFLKLDFCISDTPHSLRALVYYLTRPKVRLFSIRSTLLLQLICQHSGSALMNTELLRVWRSLFA